MLEAMFAAALAMAVTFAVGHPLLVALRQRKLGKAYSGDEPEAYAAKAGTPTMGGIIFLIGISVAAVPFAVLRDTDVLLPFLAMLAGGALGTYDDLQTLSGKEKLSGHETWFFFVKWAVLLGIGAVVAAELYFRLDFESVFVPHFGAYNLGALYLPIVVVVFVAATSGAVITDGMDGLMAGVSAFAYAAYGAIALAQGQEALGAFAFAVAGGCAAFLWFNTNPAQVFMGDLGAQALAVGLVPLAFMTGWWLLLPVIAVVFFLEGLSDVVQIVYFKRTGGRRILRMAPIHYHFQLGGWTETEVVTRFWLVGMLGAALGIALARLD